MEKSKDVYIIMYSSSTMLEILGIYESLEKANEAFKEFAKVFQPSGADYMGLKIIKKRLN